jgi:hypothetical protein
MSLVVSKYYLLLHFTGVIFLGFVPKYVYICTYIYQISVSSGVSSFKTFITLYLLNPKPYTTTTTTTRGVSHCVALPFTSKKYLKAKEEEL